MGNVSMEASQINYRGGETKMSVEQALKETSGEAAAIAQLQTDVGNLQTTKANQITIAPFFSAETAYDPGDLVYYNGLTYRCVNAHEGEWDADDFAATTISNELDALKSGLTSVGKLDEPLLFQQTDKASTISFTGTLGARSYLARLVIVGQNGVTECINVMVGGAIAGTPADLSQTYIRVSDNTYGVASSGNSDGKITLAAGINGGWGVIYVIPVHGNIGTNNVSIEYAS